MNSAILEVCHCLEEENISLQNSNESLKRQLDEQKQEQAISQLIPHYRLVILRSRAYSANLLEQLRRERVSHFYLFIYLHTCSLYV